MTPDEMKKITEKIVGRLHLDAGFENVAFVNEEEIDGSGLPLICFEFEGHEMALELSLA